MTVVEFFACAPVENMVSCFMLKPDKVIFVGGGRRAKRRISAYEQIAKRMGINALFVHKSVAASSINSVVECLAQIVNTEEDLCFDLTGGDDLALVAMGIVYERYKESRCLQMVRYNFNSRKMTDCDGDGQSFVKMQFPYLTVSENVALHGGVVSSGINGNKLTDRDDVAALWGICRTSPNSWNKCIATLSELLSVARLDNGGMKIFVDGKQAQSRYHDYQRRKTLVLKLLKSLSKQGLVRDLREIGDSFGFEYKNDTVKRVLSKSGNALEYKMLDVASSLKDKNGTPVFSDCVCGTVIDWDGLTVGSGVSFGGTVNEIDLLLMKGLTPIFISCKNGGVDEVELYKLNTVAARFGNRYAKKVLVASGLNKTGQGLMYFKERAENLGVVLVEKVHRLTDNDIEKILLKL